MKISVAMAFNEFTTPELIKAAVQMAEAKGVHGIWVPEHVLFFPEYASTYPYSEDGRLPGDPGRSAGSIQCSDVYCGPYGTGPAGDGHLSRTSATAGLHGEDGV